MATWSEVPDTFPIEWTENYPAPVMESEWQANVDTYQTLGHIPGFHDWAQEIVDRIEERGHRSWMDHPATVIVPAVVGGALFLAVAVRALLSTVWGV